MRFSTILSVIALTGLWTRGQPILVYDQQSSSNETPPLGGNVLLQSAAPYGQSFTPSFDRIEFIKLQFADPNPGNSLGATLLVNLRTNSLTGPILAGTSPVSLIDGFSGIATFTFSNSVQIVPSALYFFEPVVQSGDFWNINAAGYNYPGGTAFYQGSSLSGSDVWFREGTISVPEPSTARLAVAGGALLLWFLRRRSSASG